MGLMAGPAAGEETEGVEGASSTLREFMKAAREAGSEDMLSGFGI